MREICSWRNTKNRRSLRCTCDAANTSVLDLQRRLFFDLERTKLPVDEVDVQFRPYSKSYYGRYFPMCDIRDKPKIYIYPFENANGDLMSYDEIFSTAVHEFCHHIQYAGGHIRVRGVMHDTQFWKLYNHYIEVAKDLEIVCEVAQ